MRLKVCETAELDKRPVKTFEWKTAAGTKEGLVVKTEDGIYACDRYCTFDQFPLDFGKIVGAHTIRCTSCHGSEFDLTTGKATQPPAKSPVNVFPVVVEGGVVSVDVPDA